MTKEAFEALSTDEQRRGSRYVPAPPRQPVAAAAPAVPQPQPQASIQAWHNEDAFAEYVYSPKN